MGEWVPCPHVYECWDEDWKGNPYRYIACSKFNGGDGHHTHICCGDMRRCPSSRMRAEAVRLPREGGKSK